MGVQDSGAKGSVEWAAFADVLALIGAAAAMVMGLALVIGSHDPAFAFHGLLLLLAGIAAGIFILNSGFSSTTAADSPTDYFDGPIKVAIASGSFFQSSTLRRYCGESGLTSRVSLPGAVRR